MLKTWRYNFDWRTGGRWVLYLIEVWLAAIWSKKGWFFIRLSQHVLGCSFQAFRDNLSLKIFVREKQKTEIIRGQRVFCHHVISSYSRFMCFSKQPVKGEVCNHANFYQISKYGYSVTVEINLKWQIGTKLQECCNVLFGLKLCSCWAIHTCMISDT